MRLLIFLSFLGFLTAVQARRCPSFCTADMKGCKAKGGKILGYCINGLACCDLTIKQTGSCGDVKTGLMHADFISPHYPNPLRGDLLCTFSFVFMEAALAAKIEFLDITMDGLGFAGHGGKCDSDMIIFRGFKNWTPPSLCGNLTGYTTVIERDHGDVRMDRVEILALMSSLNYKFKIRISQIMDPKAKPPSSGKLLHPLKPDVHRQNENTHTKSMQANHGPRTFKLPQGPTLFDDNRLASADQRTLYSDPDEQPVDGDPEDGIDDLINPFIVHGADTDITQVPWQVSIRLRHFPRQNGTNSTESGEEDDDEEEGDSGSLPLDQVMALGNVSLASNDTEELNTTLLAPPKPTMTLARNCSKEEGHHFCGGSIISSRFILTAAHCFHGNTKLRGMEVLPNLKVVVGDTDSCTRDLMGNGSRLFPNLTQEEHEIETVVIHYGYDDVALLNDVALVKLKRPLSFNPSVRKIRMAAPGEKFEGQEALGSGWGMTNLTARGAKLPYVLQSSPHFLIRNQSECNRESERLFGARQGTVVTHPKYATAFQSVICSSTTNATREKLRGEVLVGPGDSGGPLVVPAEGGEHVLIGIVSYGIPPANPKTEGEFIDFFQNVAFFNNWINLAMTV